MCGGAGRGVQESFRRVVEERRDEGGCARQPTLAHDLRWPRPALATRPCVGHETLRWPRDLTLATRPYVGHETLRWPRPGRLWLQPSALANFDRAWPPKSAWLPVPRTPPVPLSPRCPPLCPDRPPPDHPKFGAFFPSPAPIFVSFSLSLGIFLCFCFSLGEGMREGVHVDVSRRSRPVL